MLQNLKFPLLFLLFTCVSLSLAHIRLRTPPQRSSIWRDPEFAQYNPEPNYDDWSINCGAAHQLSDFANCGVCGDALSASTPRDNENGGKYGKGIVVGKYSAGQTIDIGIEIYPTHLGHFEFHLCHAASEESETCFSAQPIQFGNGASAQPVDGTMDHYFNTTIVLPSNVRCDRCVLRAQYIAGNNWGDCGDGTSGVGCGPQEAFRNCADITIS